MVNLLAAAVKTLLTVFNFINATMRKAYERCCTILTKPNPSTSIVKAKFSFNYDKGNIHNKRHVITSFEVRQFTLPPTIGHVIQICISF